MERDGASPVTRTLADFAVGLDARSLPPAVREAAGLCLLDWLGTAVRGATEPLATALGAVIRAAGGEPQATIVGRGFRTSALMAALANGAQAHALDFDDTHLPSLLHASAPVAPVVLAVGEWRRARAPDGLAAFVAGFEVETRIGRVLGPALAERGWHVTGVLGTLGAAVAGAKMLGLDAGQIEQALGIAGTQAAGLVGAFGTMSKPLHPGKAAMNGLLAAQLAGEGFTGPAGILESPRGLPATFLGPRELGSALEGLGQRWEILENSSKPYAACHLTHATIDATRLIRERWAPRPEAIAAVECRVFPFTLQVAATPAPRTGLEAKFSVAFCAALGLTRGDAGEAEFSDEAVQDPVLAGLTGRVTPQADPSMAIGQAAVTVRLTDGRVLEERVKAARGTAENPQTREELEEKFRRLAAGVLPPERVRRLLETLRGLEAVEDLGEIARLAAG